MKYLVKVDYFCNQVQKGGEWLEIESDKEPQIGVINPKPFESGPLASHGCKRYYYSDGCDMDSSCNWQNILEIIPYSEEKANELNAKPVPLETRALQSHQ